MKTLTDIIFFGKLMVKVYMDGGYFDTPEDLLEATLEFADEKGYDWEKFLSYNYHTIDEETEKFMYNGEAKEWARAYRRSL